MVMGLLSDGAEPVEALLVLSNPFACASAVPCSSVDLVLALGSSPTVMAAIIRSVGIQHCGIVSSSIRVRAFSQTPAGGSGSVVGKYVAPVAWPLGSFDGSSVLERLLVVPS